MELQVGVKAVIRDKSGKILLLKRSQPFHDEQKPHWDIPGGRIDPKQDLHSALVREVQEETGLTVTDIGGVLAVQDIFSKPKPFRVVRITFEIKAKGSVTLSDEHSDYSWFPEDAIPVEETDSYFVEALRKKQDYNK